MLSLDFSKLEYGATLAHFFTLLVGTIALLGFCFYDLSARSMFVRVFGNDIARQIIASLAFALFAYATGLIIYLTSSMLLRFVEVMFIKQKKGDGFIATPSWKALVKALLVKLGLPEPQRNEEWPGWVGVMHGVGTQRGADIMRTVNTCVLGIGLVLSSFFIAYSQARRAWIVVLAMSAIAAAFGWTWQIVEYSDPAKTVGLQEVQIIRFLMNIESCKASCCDENHE